MKLKMKAERIGVLVPAEDRIHLMVCLPCRTKCIAVFVDKTWTVGRTIDALADKAKVRLYWHSLG